MSVRAESEYNAWSILEREGRLTPEPLPPSNVNWQSPTISHSAQERLMNLHKIVQHSLEHAEIPRYRIRRTKYSFPTNIKHESSPSNSEEGVGGVGGGTYLNCMEQLVLAQFENLARKDIMLLEGELYASLKEENYKNIFSLVHHLTLTNIKSSTTIDNNKNNNILVDYINKNNESLNFVSSPLLEMHALKDLMWQETNERQFLLLKEASQFGSIILEAEVLNRFSIISKLNEKLKKKFDAGDAKVWGQSIEIAQPLNYSENEYTYNHDDYDHINIKRVNEIQESISEEQLINLVPIISPTTSIECKKEIVTKEDSSLCSNSHLCLNSPILGESLNQNESIVNKSEKKEKNSISVSEQTPSTIAPTLTAQCYFISGHIYRSCVPHVKWQLRFYKFDDGVLRFSKPTPDGKYSRWWTVLIASDILHVELDDSENRIGEAKPPLCRSDSCCFSVYFKRRSDSVMSRLRLCCAKQSDTLTWFFTLRHAAQITIPSLSLSSNIVLSQR